MVAPPEAEQAELSGLLFGLDERVAAERATMRAAEALKKALMSVLLTGEVRVKPDEELA